VKISNGLICIQCDEVLDGGIRMCPSCCSEVLMPMAKWIAATEFGACSAGAGSLIKGLEEYDMELQHNKDFQKTADDAKLKYFDGLKGCTVRCYLDVTERKNSKAKPMTLRRATAVERLEKKFDLILVGRQQQLGQMGGDLILRILLRFLGKVDEKDGVFTVGSSDLELSRAEVEHLGLPEEVETWTQGNLFQLKPKTSAPNAQAQVAAH